MKTRPKHLSSSQFILLGFLAVILVGTLLLWLPVSTTDGIPVSFSTALFTSTTATCVTGLVVVPTVSWSIFGQAVILVLIQIGGFGVVAVMTGILIFLQKKIGFGDRILLQDAFNLNSLAGIVAFTKKVIISTFIVEAIGAVCCMFVFIPEFGLRGIWVSVFHAVSAFCNAGMDIIGESSLYEYVSNPVLNLVTMLLIILGGLGYIVWWDVLRVFKKKIKGKKQRWHSLTLHSKITISTTLALIVLGALCFFAFEYANTMTMRKLTLPEKVLASFFQSVTTRTAGFASLPQENLTTASSVLSMILMFIGGSPVGTAGGIKTVTFMVLLLVALSTVRGKRDVTIFHRRIAEKAVRKCVAVGMVSLTLVLISTILLSLTTNRGFLDILYEIVSATGTVGLSKNLTSSLNLAGRLIVIITMYLGRVGPISLAVSFHIKRENENIIKEPTEEISVG